MKIKKKGKMGNFLERLFERLNREKIFYVVLGNYELLPKSLGNSDLDLLVSDEQVLMVKRLIIKLVVEYNAILVSYSKKSQSYFFRIELYYNNENGIAIDLLPIKRTYRGSRYICDDFIYNNIIEYNGINVVENSAACFMGLIKELIFTKSCKRKYYDNSLLYWNKEKERIRRYFDLYFSPNLYDQLNFMLNQKNYDIFLIESRNISLRMRHTFFKSKMFSNRRKYKYLIDRFLLLGKKNAGFSVAFLGTDGSGKTTIIDAITPIFSKTFNKMVYYEHMRPNFLPSLAVLFGKKDKDAPVVVNTNPHGSETSGFLGSLFRFFYYYVDYVFGYCVKIKYKKMISPCLWIFDRYFYDYVNDSRRARIALPHWLMAIFGLFVPSPDIVICLGAKPEIIHARKPELPIEEVNRQVNCLKEFAMKNKKAVWVDTGCSKEESIEKTIEAITNMMSNKFKCVLR